MIIDAHQHFWNLDRASYPWLGPDLAPIDRTIEFDELAPILERTGIDRTVLVQSADNDEDTRYMLQVAAEHPEIAGVVAYVPLHQPQQAADRLDQLRRNPMVVGVRNLIHDQPDPDWLIRPEVDEGLGMLAERAVSFDVVSVLPRHLELVTTLSERHPDLRMVIDHLSKPPIKAQLGQAGRPGHSGEPWRSLITAAAENPQVYAKVSGLYPPVGASEDWAVDDLRPWFEFAYELFGPRRLMYGGDWPISITAGGYDRVWGALSTLFDELEPADRDAILAGTAIEFYGLPESRLPESR